jgi:putative transcriptional regulator
VKKQKKVADMQGTLADQLIAGLREFSEALENGEDISERFTCHRFKITLRPVTFSAKKVQQIRGLLHASQTVFALFLGVSVRAVRSWEQGRQAPSPIACRFMDEIQRDPGYWRNRLCESVVAK